MARPKPTALQYEVAAAIRGARQGGVAITRIKIKKCGATGDIEIEIETTLAPEPSPTIEEPERDAGGLTPLQRRIAEYAQKIR